LTFACWNGHIATVELLIAKGAAVEAKNKVSYGDLGGQAKRGSTVKKTVTCPILHLGKEPTTLAPAERDVCIQCVCMSNVDIGVKRVKSSDSAALSAVNLSFPLVLA
jgi:ankyrin repeat protein